MKKPNILIMEMNFNNYGNLEPATAIETNLNLFESIFTFNEHRGLIFQEYLLFLKRLEKIGLKEYYQWIDGSFVTQKIKPRDIDVVTFLSYEQYEKNERTLSDLYRERKQGKVDCCFVKVYPIGHEKYYHTYSDGIEYAHLFSQDRNKNYKGYIQINL